MYLNPGCPIVLQYVLQRFHTGLTASYTTWIKAIDKTAVHNIRMVNGGAPIIARRMREISPNLETNDRTLATAANAIHQLTGVHIHKIKPASTTLQVPSKTNLDSNLTAPLAVDSLPIEPLSSGFVKPPPVKPPRKRKQPSKPNTEPPEPNSSSETKKKRGRPPKPPTDITANPNPPNAT
jgi:hypothetical protein